MITHRQATIYYAPTKRRHYITRRGAAKAEAAALLCRKYPTEHGTEDDGYSCWHWSGDERLNRVYARLVRRLLRGPAGYLKASGIFPEKGA